MQYILDGHNLIGRCRTIRLGETDDEAKLVNLLHRWVLRHPQHRITVVFDHGVYGHPQSLDRPQIKALFAYSPQDADTRLIKLIHQATSVRQLRVVSADQAIVRAAQARGIEVVGSDQFAAQLEQPRRAPSASVRSRRRIEPKLPKQDVDRWLEEFGAADEGES